MKKLLADIKMFENYFSINSVVLPKLLPAVLKYIFQAVSGQL